MEVYAEITIVCIISIAIILAFLGNLGVVIVVYKNSKMWNVINMFICNLAVSDIFFGSVMIPQLLHDVTHTDEFHEGEFACRITNAIPITCVMVSIYTLVAVAVERHQAIVQMHKKQISFFDAKMVIGGIWLLAIVVAIPSAAEYSVYVKPVVIEENNTCSHSQSQTNSGCTETNTDVMPSTVDVDQTTSPAEPTQFILACGNEEVSYYFSLGNGIFIVLVAYVIPMIIIVVIYTRLILFMLKQAKQFEMASSKSGPSQDDSYKSFVTLKKKMKIIKMLVIVAVLFILSWLPYFTILIIAKITDADDSTQLNGSINIFRISLSTFSVSYNVYLYVAYSSLFRQGFKKLLTCKMGRNNQVASFQEQPPSATFSARAS